MASGVAYCDRPIKLYWIYTVYQNNDENVRLFQYATGYVDLRDMTSLTGQNRIVVLCKTGKAPFK